MDCSVTEAMPKFMSLFAEQPKMETEKFLGALPETVLQEAFSSEAERRAKVHGHV